MKVEFLALTEVAHPLPLALDLAGRIAGDQARRRLFLDYQARRDEDTRRQQSVSLAHFRAWLTTAAADPGDLYTEPAAWQGITWGLVGGFIRAQLTEGYAVATVNARLGTIKRYAALALQAGTLPHPEYTMIKVIQGYSRREALSLDRERRRAGLATRRIGAKAENPIFLNPEQVQALLSLPDMDSPQGLRDSFLLYLLLHHGLRCGEAAGLRGEALTQQAGHLVFYRPKVNRVQTHRLTPETQAAARRYREALGDSFDPGGVLLRRSAKNGDLHESRGMSTRAITARVGALGEQIGVGGLSSHDCRHTWATNAANAGTPLPVLMQAGGWSGPGMPLRYIEAAKIANAGVVL